MATRLSLRDPVGTLQRDLVELLAATAAQLGNDAAPIADRVHEARKALKRARALALLLPAPLAAQADRSLRDIHHRLGARRDRDATVEAVGRLLPLARGGSGTRAALVALRARVASASVEAPLPDIDDTRRDLLRLAHAIGREPLGGDFPLVLEGIGRVARRSRQALRRALASGRAHDFHRWRKWMKYYWFHLRYVAPLWPELLRVEANAADHAAEWLGQSQDLELVRAAIAADAGLPPAAAAALLALVDREQLRLQHKAAGLGLHLHAESPRAFTRRLRGYWAARAHAAAGQRHGLGA